ncbi:MAG TPA: hypothetical protein VJS44_20670 [Pyrinomonadaceae bacterium]|nr:hypothetical protein [Pyrinomonadaceae bacterium]
MEKVTYFGQVGCVRLSNGTVELVATVDVGPRIIRYGFPGGENILGELPGVSIDTPLGPWKPWGGHRLWTAPEANPRSYVPDNDPVEYEAEGERGLRLTQRVERETGIQKELFVTLEDEGTRVTIRHVITNRNLWAIEVAPWAITNMKAGGEAILPQEPYRSWDEYLLPARPFVLWHYTDLSDPRWTIGPRYLRLKSDERIASPQKAGVLNKQGWAAYHLRGTLFIKRFDYEEGASYPDYGSNAEVYTGGSTIEVETLSPIRRLEPGESALHTETWELFPNVNLGENEEEIEAAIGELIK